MTDDLVAEVEEVVLGYKLLGGIIMADAFLEMVARWFGEQRFAPYNINNRRHEVIELLEMVLGEPL